MPMAMSCEEVTMPSVMSSGKSPLPDVVLRGFLPQEGDVRLALADGAQAFLSRGVVPDLALLIAL